MVVKHNLLFIFIEICVFTYILMFTLKSIYISNNSISKIAYIRNISIFFVMYLVIYKGYSYFYFLIPILIYLVLDILNTYGYSIDNTENKIINCYDGIEYITRRSEMFSKEFKEYRLQNFSDYTEGKYDGNPNKPWKLSLIHI